MVASCSVVRVAWDEDAEGVVVAVVGAVLGATAPAVDAGVVGADGVALGGWERVGDTAPGAADGVSGEAVSLNTLEASALEGAAGVAASEPPGVGEVGSFMLVSVHRISILVLRVLHSQALQDAAARFQNQLPAHGRSYHKRVLLD